MNTNFVVNEYALVWYLLFQASISEPVYKIKQRLWDAFKDKYNNMFNDKILILEDYKNFIPNDDTIYNIFFESKEYQKIRKQGEKYRLEVMRIWDKNKKVTQKLYSNIIREKVDEFTFFVVSKELNIIDNPIKEKAIIGIEIDKKDSTEYLLKLNMVLVMNSIKKYNEEDNDFKNAIVELAILNEYASNLNDRSCYLNGTPSLMELKRWIYPYWLMYLGIPKDELLSRMMRDKIAFELDNYAYEKELVKMNLEEFIDFCIRNKRYIIREQKMTKQEINKFQQMDEVPEEII